MKFSFNSSLDEADLTVVPFWEGLDAAVDVSSLKKELAPLLASKDFKGKNGETAFLYPSTGTRLLLLGLGQGEKVTAEALRRAYASAVRAAGSKKCKTMNVLFPKVKKLHAAETLRGIGEGILLTNYAFTELKHDTLKENPVVLLERVSFIGLEKKDEASLKRLETIAAGVSFVRDLVNGNADDVTPQYLSRTAVSLEKISPKVKTTIFDRKRLEKEKMGLILAVGRAATVEPCLIQVSYRGNPKSKEHIVLVGKGITYDTGGLSLKTTENMLTMKCDMSGAATVLGAVKTAAELGLKVNVTAIAPVAENAIGSRSYKPGDVYRSFSGKTVEITNTDAEGRLVLADALAYAVQELKPSCMIDLASLTGAMVVALGEEVSGFFANDDAVASELMGASKQSGELLWRLPLHEDYKECYKSEIADMINSFGRDAGAVKAALFLQEFVGSVPWAPLC